MVVIVVRINGELLQEPRIFPISHRIWPYLVRVFTVDTVELLKRRQPRRWLWWWAADLNHKRIEFKYIDRYLKSVFFLRFWFHLNNGFLFKFNHKILLGWNAVLSHIYPENRNKLKSSLTRKNWLYNIIMPTVPIRQIWDIWVHLSLMDLLAPANKFQPKF